MDIDIFFIWFNGMTFGIYLLFAFTLYHDRNMYNVPRRAFVATSWLMLFLAALTLRYMFEDTDADIYYGKWQNINILENLIACPLALFIPMELSHYRRITYTVALRHIIPFVVGPTIYYMMLSHGIAYSKWMFMACMAGACIYVLYYVIVLRRAANIFEKELHNTYANDEGRAFKWYSTIVVLMILLLLFYVVLHFAYDDTLSFFFRSIAGLFFWSGLAAHVRRMRESRLIEVQEDSEAKNTKVNAEPEPQATNEIDEETKAEFFTQLDNALIERKLLFREDLSREDVAKEIDVSQTQLARWLKDVTGMTFSEYICDQRLIVASKLLTSTNEGIEQILYKCGFRSRATFHRTFTKKYHCSPTDFRRAHKIEE